MKKSTPENSSIQSVSKESPSSQPHETVANETIDTQPYYIITKRIGSTNYLVRVFFNPTAKESASDKILRLIRNELANGA